MNELLNLCSKLYTIDNIDYHIYILNNLHKFNKDLYHEHFHKLLVQYIYNPLIEINEIYRNDSTAS
jgi:predicted methyltransferase